jgi:hypothetical protein
MSQFQPPAEAADPFPVPSLAFPGGQAQQVNECPFCQNMVPCALYYHNYDAAETLCGSSGMISDLDHANLG